MVASKKLSHPSTPHHFLQLQAFTCAGVHPHDHPASRDHLSCDHQPHDHGETTFHARPSQEATGAGVDRSLSGYLQYNYMTQNAAAAGTGAKLLQQMNSMPSYFQQAAGANNLSSSWRSSASPDVSASTGGNFSCEHCGAKFTTAARFDWHQDIFCCRNQKIGCVPEDLLETCDSITRLEEPAAAAASTSDDIQLPEPEFKVLNLSDDGHKLKGRKQSSTLKPQTGPLCDLYITKTTSSRREDSQPLTGAFKCHSCNFAADKRAHLIDHYQSHTPDEDLVNMDSPFIKEEETTDSHQASPVPMATSVSMETPVPMDTASELSEKESGDKFCLESPIAECREDLEDEVKDVAMATECIDSVERQPYTEQVSKPAEEKVRKISVSGMKKRRMSHGIPATHMDEYLSLKEQALAKGDDLKARKRSDASVSGWFCAECDIKFSTKSNFEAHKEFYCGMRMKKPKTRHESRSESRSESRTAKAEPVLPHRDSSTSSQGQGQYVPNMLPSMMALSSGVAPGMMFPSPVVTPFGLAYPVPYFVPVPANMMPGFGNNLSSEQDIANALKQARSKSTVEKPLDLSVKTELELDSKKTRSMSDTGQLEQYVFQNASRLNAFLAQAARARKYSTDLTPVKEKTDESLPQKQKKATMYHCENCSIVFYNHENFIVHKTHYCAGRQAKLGQPLKSPEQGLARKSPLKAVSPGEVKDEQNSSGSAADSDEYSWQYFCLACKIKFSSLSNLEAHQQYYCPAKKMIAQQASSAMEKSINILQQAGAGSADMPCVCCPGCGLKFSNKDEIFQHVCPAVVGQATMKVPLFCCPYCEFVASTDIVLLEHIKSHAPTKAFRCKICRYRGNTIRGMRMHGKTHTDAGETFTDEDIMEYEEELAMPKRLRTVTENIRIPVSKGLAEMAQTSSVTRHLAEMNKSSPDNPAVISSVGINNDGSLICPKLSPQNRRVIPHTLTAPIKEDDDDDDKTMHQDDKDEDAEDDDGKTLFKCHTCLFTSNDVDEWNVHLKNVHGNSNDVAKATTSESDKYRIANLIASDISSKAQKNFQVATTMHNNLPMSTALMQRIQRMQLVHESQLRGCLPFSPNPPSTASLKNGLSAEQDSSKSTVNSSDKTQQQVKKGGTGKHYCKQCGISFLYLSTFLAHKRYYCNSHIGEQAGQQQQEQLTEV